jgi:hypothetical protein
MIMLTGSSFFLWRCGPTRAMASSFLRLLGHTQWRTTVGRTPLDKWLARRRDLYLTTHNTHNRQTPMPPVGFEPTIPAGERPRKHVLDRAATGTGMLTGIILNFRSVESWFVRPIISPRLNPAVTLMINKKHQEKILANELKETSFVTAVQTFQAKRSASFVGPRHHRMSRPLPADRTDGLHVWTALANMLKQQPRTCHKTLPSSVGAGLAVVKFSP